MGEGEPNGIVFEPRNDQVLEQEFEASEHALPGLIDEQQRELDELSGERSLSEDVRQQLTRAKDFVLENKLKIGIPLLLVPIVAQGIGEGLPLPAAIVKALDEVMRGDPASHMDPDRARAIVTSLTHGDLKDSAHLMGKELIEVLDDYRVAVHEVLVFSFVLKMAEGIKNLKKDKTESIEAGKEKISPKGEQLIVLGGSASYIGDALKTEDPSHVTVIYENNEGGESLVDQLEKNVNKGEAVYVNLSINSAQQTYARAPGWKNVEFNRHNLLKTKDGRELMVVVGLDDHVEEEWLGIHSEHNLPLDAQYAGSQKIRECFKEKIPTEQVVNIRVGTANLPEVDEETGDMTKTSKEVSLSNSVDIYIDTWSVVVKAIEKTIQENIDQGICTYPCGVRLVSDEFDYHRMFDKVAEGLGLPVIKPNHQQSGEAIMIVYEKNGDKTMHTAERRMHANPSQRVIAITSNLENHRLALEQGIVSICLADVVAKEIRKVRFELKSGKTPGAIQERLDTAYQVRPVTSSQTPSVDQASA